VFSAVLAAICVVVNVVQSLNDDESPAVVVPTVSVRNRTSPTARGQHVVTQTTATPAASPSPAGESQAGNQPATPVSTTNASPVASVTQMALPSTNPASPVATPLATSSLQAMATRVATSITRASATSSADPTATPTRSPAPTPTAIASPSPTAEPMPTRSRPTAPGSNPSGVPAEAVLASVEGVTDDGRVRVNIGDETISIQLLGVTFADCYSAEAESWLRDRLPVGRRVYLEPDPSVPATASRWPAYLWIIDGEGEAWLLNELLLRRGYGHLDSARPDLAYSKRLRVAEGEARAGKRGVWKCAP
jgi:endonuclease YncB( thermonuclease family)